MINDLEVDLRPKLGLVRDQGARRTCLSHALTASHEYVRGSHVRLSAEYLHYFATGGLPSQGASIAGARLALERDGQPEERFCPDLLKSPPGRWKPDDGCILFRRKSISLLHSCREVERAIRETRIPVLGIRLPHAFFRPEDPWVIPPGNRTYGLHAVVGAGLGLHEEDLVVLIRNSWGADWGENGHALLSENFLDRHLVDVMLLTEELTG